MKSTRPPSVCLILMVAVMLGGCARHPVDASRLDHDLLTEVEQGNLATVRQLLSDGAHADAKNQNGETALLIAAGRRKTGGKDSDSAAIVQLLLEKGASLEAKDANASTALIV